ncbi:MAG: M36 family metallopeptidase [Myxococcales bacterium]|nr:M36 family metallopeptidase [Myxococcales bacterium]MCB9576278.1 M36 family metallopeptidase [Polyangiaceae bacterium]
MRAYTLASIVPLLLLSSTALAAPSKILTGPFAATPSKDVVSTARAAVTPSAHGATLEYRSVTADVGTSRVVRFAQTHQGVPVLFRGAGVVLRKDGTPAFAVVRTEDQLPSTSPAISEAQALADATSLAKLTAKPGDARLTIYPTASGPRLSWVVVPSARLSGVPWVPVVIIDAQSGERIAAWNAARFAGAAKVYASNPVASPSLMDVTLPVGTGETTLTNATVQSLNCVDTKQAKDISISGFNLKVHVCELKQLAAADSNGDFLDAPGADKEPEDSFSEISMFYHVNVAYDFFTAMGMTELSTKPLPTVSNLMLPDGVQTFDTTKMADPNLPFVPFQNAFFAPANPLFSGIFGLTGAAMWFGQGPARDYSYDGDVVYHEFTHAVVDHTLKLVGTYHADEQGLSSSPGAMNEGLADYFSSAITGDPKVGEYASQDLAPGLPAIRDLSNKNTCPANITGEVHSDSQFWSAALWAARSGLSAADQPKFDKAIFDVMAASPGGDLGFDELAQLFITSVKTAIDQTAADALQKEMTDRGVLPGCQRVLEYADKPINGADPFLGGAFWAPGTQDAAISGAPYAPGVLQFHASFPGATQMTVSFNEVQTGGGGSSPFGGGTPFTPQIVVRFGNDPITFDYSSGLSATADATTDAPIAGGKGSATFEVPEGATSAYVMIVNGGQSSGGYKNVDFAFEGAPQADAGVGDGGVPEGGADAGASPTPKASEDDSGCGCRVAGQSQRSSAFALLLAALGLAFARRRR